MLIVAACATPMPATARSTPDSFAPLVRRVLPAVVNISVLETTGTRDPLADLPADLRDGPLGRELRRRFGQKRERMSGAGSGFIVDPSGVIVTNNHVVGRASTIVVQLSDGRQFPARVAGHDELTDLAVLRIDGVSDLPYVSWGDSRLVEAGDWILAAGNPFGLGGSVTAGIVSARGRDLGAGPFDNFLQLDAPINPGNSGGPVFNMDGQVVGVSAIIISPTGASVGIGFAIPSETAGRVVAQLVSRGSIARGWLGVAVEEQDGAVRITGVDRSGPAARAGLRPGDTLLAVNGERVDTGRGLVRAVAAVPPGERALLTVRRQGRDFELSVTVGRRPAEGAG
jgi:serine protease Do